MIEFKCSADGCFAPWAYIYNGVLSAQSRHSGKIHTNAIGLTELYRIMRASQGMDTLTPADIAMSTARRTLVELPGHPEPVPGFELVCIDKHCTLPWGVVANGTLAVVSWHQERHANTVHVDVLHMLFNARYQLNGVKR